jgi:hypothetical protein
VAADGNPPPLFHSVGAASGPPSLIFPHLCQSVLICGPFQFRLRLAALQCNPSESRISARLFPYLCQSVLICGPFQFPLRLAALRFLRLFSANQLNLLSMNNLQLKSSISN